MYLRITPSLRSHSLLIEHISHYLRLRALQELEMLVARLRAAPKPKSLTDHTIVRRLTRSEWDMLKTEGRIPWKDAIFVVVAPPVNRDPITKVRVKPGMDVLPPPVEKDEQLPLEKPMPPLPPLSELFPVSLEPQKDDPLEDGIKIRRYEVPLYNGLPMFPIRAQRALLHKYLSQLAGIERKASHYTKQDISDNENREKQTFAYLFYSNEQTVQRVDTVPLAIALWRIRMWEGAGWGQTEWLKGEL